MHWKIVDDLIKDHNELIQSIRTKKEDQDDDGDQAVGSFLNQPSPTKKRKAVVVQEVNNESDAVDFCHSLFDDLNEFDDNGIVIEKVAHVEKENSDLVTEVDVKKNQTQVAKEKSSKKASVPTNESTMTKRSTGKKKGNWKSHFVNGSFE